MIQRLLRDLWPWTWRFVLIVAIVHWGLHWAHTAPPFLLGGAEGLAAILWVDASRAWRKWRCERQVEWETRLLQAIWQLEREGRSTHGAHIHELMETYYGTKASWWGVSIAAVYNTLEQMEAQGRVRSWTEPGGSERGYREKRCWSVVEGEFAGKPI